MTDLFPPTRQEAIAEIDRELEMRASVYARWVKTGKMSRHKADRQIQMLRHARTLLQRDGEFDGLLSTISRMTLRGEDGFEPDLEDQHEALERIITKARRIAGGTS